MSNSLNDKAIVEAVRILYEQAGLATAHLQSSIAPLAELMMTFNIRMEELYDLHYASAKHFLEKNIQHEVVMRDDKEELAGFLYAQQIDGYDYGVVLIRANDLITRRRFSAAHEIGHYALHFQRLLEEDPNEIMTMVDGINQISDEKTGSVEDVPQGEFHFTRGTLATVLNNKQLMLMEREANQFAAELLMPEPVCRDRLMSLQKRLTKNPKVLITHLASEFLVSEAAMQRRLHHLHLITAA